MGGWVARMKNTRKEGKKSKGNLKMEEKQTKKTTFFMKKKISEVFPGISDGKKKTFLGKCLKDHQQIESNWCHDVMGCKYWIISPSEPGTSPQWTWDFCCDEDPRDVTSFDPLGRVVTSPNKVRIHICSRLPALHAPPPPPWYGPPPYPVPPYPAVLAVTLVALLVLVLRSTT